MIDESKLDDGGPAFPIIAHADAEAGRVYLTQQIMTLRDHFAGQLAPSIALRYAFPDPARIADEAYEMADAMLKARARRRR